MGGCNRQSATRDGQRGEEGPTKQHLAVTAGRHDGGSTLKPRAKGSSRPGKLWHADALSDVQRALHTIVETPRKRRSSMRRTSNIARFDRAELPRSLTPTLEPMHPYPVAVYRGVQGSCVMGCKRPLSVHPLRAGSPVGNLWRMPCEPPSIPVLLADFGAL
jgi:hypothetical protein